MLPQLPVVLFSLLLFSTFLGAQIAQQAATSAAAGLQGKVLDADGRPAPGVQIELKEAPASTTLSTALTDSDGSFALYNIPPGQYQLVAESSDASVTSDAQLPSDRATLEMRLPAPPRTGYAQATVSVAHLRVPERARTIYGKAEQAYVRGNYKSASELVDRALLIAPQYAEAVTLRGLVKMQASDLPGAERDLEQAIHIDPNYGLAYLVLAAIYNHQDRLDDAMRASERGEALCPRSWQGYFEMAKVSMARGMYQKALQFAKQAEKLGGNGFAPLHLTKAYVFISLKLYKDARQELQAFLSREPSGESAERAHTLLAEINAAAALEPAR